MKTILRSRDISCASCIDRIERALEKVEGVQRTSVLFATGRIEVEHDPRRAPVERLIESLHDAGYDARVSHS